MEPSKIFGRGIAFPPHLDATGGFALSEGPANIRESVKMILLTEPGERIMLPDFGGGITSFLYEPNIISTRRRMQERIIQALNRWESRIQLQSVRVDADPGNPQGAVISIEYKLVATGELDQIALSFQFAAAGG